MITGYNTDVEHEGVVYHVQTEDKGLDSPLILSLVYSGGAILASKRARYDDLVAAGFDEAELTERLKRQHRLICAAIRAGRLADLKRLGEGTTGKLGVPRPDLAKDTTAPLEAPLTPAPAVPEPEVAPLGAPKALPPDIAAYSIYDSRRRSPLGTFPESEEGLHLCFLEDQNLRGGDSVTLKIVVTNRGPKDETPMGGVSVSVKVLGTTFRPVIYSVKTERDGIATVAAQIPQFTSGRAAILVRADADGQETEIRRVIHPGQ